MGQNQKRLLQAYLCINVPAIAVCLWYNISFEDDLLPLIGTIIGVVGAVIGLQKKELPIIRLIMYFFIVVASILQAVAVILLWAHMDNMLTSECIDIECYQEVPFSSTQSTCETEKNEDWDITCYGYKEYTELPKAIHCGKLWCSDEFEDCSKEKGPYDAWYQEDDCESYWKKELQERHACLFLTAIILLISLFFIFVVLAGSLWHARKDPTPQSDGDTWTSPAPHAPSYSTSHAPQQPSQGRQKPRPPPSDFYYH